MKKIIAITALLSSMLLIADSNEDFEGDFLAGDEKLACEAILCLAANGATPSECKPSLKKYFSITAKKAHKQAAKRKAFLNLCPR